ncbi:hypothetical protein FACS189493_0030 [Spirochaetia bacterium]|nr:hypothetical protein FACS189493_0030 [Spirochaetia bacterium]
MEAMVKSFEEISTALGKSVDAFIKIIGRIRVNYIMDEIFDVNNELKFRQSGKTLVTFYIKDGMFTVLIIFGKEECIKFENEYNNFSKYINDYYKNSKTYHDGKWMFIDVVDDRYVDDIIGLIEMKKKSNRKKEHLDKGNLGKCGNRCDLCLLYVANNKDGKQGWFEFQEGDWKCYHNGDIKNQTDYSKYICKGCHSDCEVVKCVLKKGIENCQECNYNLCNINANNFTNPGRCNIGLSAEDITKFVLPYWGKERFDQMKQYE